MELPDPGRSAGAARSTGLPGGAWIGAFAIAFGIVLDLAAHSFAAPHAPTAIPPDQHLAHLVVVVGMVLVLAAIVRDGVRNARRTAGRSFHDAVR
jgi:hypothetical protein